MVLTPLVVSQEFGPQVLVRGFPFSFRAGLASSGTNSSGQQFSCGVIDIVESMSHRVFLTAVCAPPSWSFFLNFYDVTLSDSSVDFVRGCVCLIRLLLYIRASSSLSHYLMLVLVSR